MWQFPFNMSIASLTSFAPNDISAYAPKRIIIDTDPGIDDSLAILLALASPEVSLEGLSVVHGNCSLDRATINALSVLELAKASHIPLASGCELPLVQPSLLAPETHGNTGRATQNSRSASSPSVSKEAIS